MSAAAAEPQSDKDPIVPKEEGNGGGVRKRKVCEETHSSDLIESDLFEHVTLSKPQNLGLFYDKAAESFTARLVFLPAVIYPFFGVYLNMQGHLYASVNSCFAMIWCLKVVWGFFSDSTPIFGKRRIYYMALGWTISVVAYSVAVSIPYPEPYYATSHCHQDVTRVINPSAPQQGIHYIVVLSVAVFGVAIVDLAADALVVDYTKREPLATRGTCNAYAHVAASFGAVLLFLIQGFALNSPEYGGEWCGLTFTYRDILVVFLCVSVFGLFNSLFFTVDPIEADPVPLKQQIAEFWQVVKLRVFQRVSILFVMVPALMNARSSGMVKIRHHWAGVTPFANSMASVGAALLVAVGMIILQNVLLQKSWPKLYIVVKSYCLLVALAVETLTIFDVVRNQYFYFSEELIQAVGTGMTAFILLQLAAEISEEGNEALTFGVLMTNWSLSHSLSAIIGNFASAHYGVTEDLRYLRDSPDDRMMVYYSVLTGFGINILAMPVMYLLCPDQRQEVHDMKKWMGSSSVTAGLYVLLFLTLLALTFTFNMLVMSPSTSCLVIVGGEGCHHA